MQALVQVGARLRAVVDRLQVDGDDARVRRVAGDGHDVVGGHHDRVALEEARAAGVDHRRRRAGGVERRGHLVAPDRVAGDVEHRLARRLEHEAGDRRHRLADPAGAVARAGARDPHAVPVERVLDRPHVLEAVRRAASRRPRAGRTRGRSFGSSRIAVSSRWSRCRCVTSAASRPLTTTSAGSGSSTSGLRTGFAVSSTGGRAPAGSSIGSTSTQRPAALTSSVALRIRRRRIPAEAYPRPVRGHYEDFWADAPADPEPWAWERRRALLLGEARPGERVLDLGCGAGRFVAALRDAGADPVGVELAEAALERARAQRARAPTCAGWRPTARSRSSTRASTSCGARRCSSTSPTRRICCSRSAACCGPAGGCWSTVPYHGRVKAALIALARFDAHFDPLGQHLRFYTRRSLAATLRARRLRRRARARRGGAPLLRTGLTARARRP